MATAAENLSISAKSFIKNSTEFEINVKNKLKWNKKQWADSGEYGSRFNKLCNSLTYWKSKLKPAIEDTSVIITVFNEEKDVKTDLFSIVTAIEELDCNVRVQGFADFRNPRYVCIYFKNKEERDEVRSKFRMLDNNFIVYMSWALGTDDPLTFLKVHWLPMTLNIEIIKKELDKYVQCIEEQRNAINFMSGRELQSGKVSFKVKIKKDVKIESIPHLLNIAGMEALITVKGRQPLCLNCDLLGHISRDCKLRYCQTCNSLKIKGHECLAADGGLTYADRVKRKRENLELNDLDEPITINNPKILIKEKELLNDKIDGLEKQLLNLQAEDQKQLKAQIQRGLKSNHDSKEQNSFPLGTDNHRNPEFNDQFGSWSMEDSDNQEEDEQPENMADDFTLDTQNAESQERENEEKEKTTQKAKKKKTLSSAVVKTEKVRSYEECRTYGRPNLKNNKRRAEEKKLNKVFETREFLFRD